MTEESAKSTFEVLSVESNRPARRASGLPAALALLLAAGAIGASGWNWYEMREVRAQLEHLRTGVDTLAARPERAPDPRLAEVLRGLEQAEARMTGVDTRIDALAADTDALRTRLGAITVADRRDWALAEAEYLERLASQSLLMGREVRGALALLTAADGILRDLDDPSLHAARAALATDIAELRAVSAFDVEGLYLRLSALVEQVPALALMERSRAEALGGGLAEPAPPESWWSRIGALLGRYVVVRQRNESIKPLLPLAEEGYLRINLRLGLEQAKLALLAAEPAVYRGALAQVQQFAATYLAASPAANQAFLHGVAELAAIEVAPALPDISDSLRALRERAVTVASPAAQPAPAPAPAETGPAPAPADAGNGEQ